MHSRESAKSWFRQQIVEDDLGAGPVARTRCVILQRRNGEGKVGARVVDTASGVEQNARYFELGMLPVSNLPSRLLLIVDDLERGELLARHLKVEGHEVRWARDTMEARWVWMRNYFDSVIVCAHGANGFIERIKKESPQQNISVVSPEELAVREETACERRSVSTSVSEQEQCYPNAAFLRQRSAAQMNTRTLLLIILILLLIGAFPIWPYSAGWGDL